MMDFELLPVIASCSGCGACCRVQGAPPDYVALSLNPDFAHEASFAEDVARLRTLSPPARRPLERYLDLTSRGLLPTDGPCVWLNESLDRCLYYEERPSTCRVFEMGGPGCFYYRRQAGSE